MTQAQDKKKLINNFIALFIVQGSNYLIPLITFPYIVHTIGIEKFGLISFATAFIAYPTLLVIYGLDLSGVREVAAAKNSKRRLDIIFSSILLTRAILIVLAAILTFSIVFSFDRFSSNWLLYVVSFSAIIGTTIFPIWFFQGMEKMKFITYLSVASKILYLIGIFIFVHSEEDYLYVPLLYAATSFLMGLVSLYLIRKEFGVSFIFPRIKYIIHQFYRGWHLFIAHLSVSLFTSFNMLVLGLVASDLVVGYYALAEKIVKIVVSLFNPVNQAIFPHVVQLAKKSKEKASTFMNKISFYILSVGVGIWAILFFFSEDIFGLVFGEKSLSSIPVFNILSLLIIIMPLAAWVYNVILIAFKMEKYFVKIFTFIAVINAIIIGVSLPWFESKENVIAMSLVCSELISLLIGLYIYRSKILLNRNTK